MKYLLILGFLLTYFINCSTTITRPFQSFNNREKKVIKRLSSSLKSIFKKERKSEPKKERSRNTFRDVLFWAKAGRIYSSYKLTQAKNKIKNVILRKQGPVSNETWSDVHELNSDRMINLCLDLKGFYLKTGQFLGTRHDFMPPNYTRKLSQLHDSVPPLTAVETRKNIEKELNGTIEEYFDYLDLNKPLGCASIAQVHEGIWKKTGEKVAVKIQYPKAEYLMKRDLKNLRKLAEFLQKTELKFDLLSAIIELQKQIGNEFDFLLEAKNMDIIGKKLIKSVPEVILPRPIWASKKVLVMSFVEGQNLGRLSEFRDKAFHGNKMPLWMKHKFATNLLNILSKAWGEQIFTLNMFNADPHPGNICISRSSNRIGLLDWGQVKRLPLDLLYKFSVMVTAIHHNNKSDIIKAFHNLGIEVVNPLDHDTVHKIAVTMLDTRSVPGYIIDPFNNPMDTLQKNAVTKFPSDLYFVVRTIQLLRGISYAFDLNYSLADQWAPLAKKTIQYIKEKKPLYSTDLQFVYDRDHLI